MLKKIILAAAVVALWSSSSLASVTASSGDIQLKAGQWTELAARYPIPGANMQEGPSSEVLASWWNSFHDETLTKLIKMALENNRNLSNARSKVVEARASLGIEKSASLPWLDSNNYWQMNRNPVETQGKRIDVSKLGIDASWEIDIFGGRRQAAKAKAAELEATYADMNSVWSSLAAEVAVDYISLRTLQERLSIARQNLKLQQDTCELAGSRYKAGLSDMLALEQAEYTLEQTKATIPPLEASVEEVKNGLKY